MNNLHFIKWVFSNRNYTDIIYRLISLFLGYPLLLLSYLIPRSKRKWVLGYKVGFTDNVKYLYRYLYKYTSLQKRCKSVDRQRRTVGTDDRQSWSLCQG